MAFKTITDLDTQVTVALGGVNRKTNKPNPKSIEGYYLGSKKVESKKSKSGYAYLYILQTAKGNVGVWGKTDMDRKMSQAILGAMTRITHTGMQSTSNGEMYKYSVEVDTDNSIEVNASSSTDSNEDISDEPSFDSSEELDSSYSLDSDEESFTPPPTLSSDKKSKVAAILSRNKK